MLFLQLVRALSLQRCVVFLLCIGRSMWFILIVLVNHDSQVCNPHYLHRVCRSVYLAFFTVYAPPPPQRTVSSTMIEVLCSRWLDYNVWSDRCLDWELQFLVQVCFECPVGCLLYDALLLCVADWHRHGAFFDELDEGDACVSRVMFFFCSSSNMWACSLETTLWRHLYLPWLRVTLHEYSIWSRVPHFHKYYILGCLCGTFGIYWLLNTTVLLVICACFICSLSLEHSKVFQPVLYIWLMNALSSWWLNYRVSWSLGIYKWAMLFFWYLKGFI